VASSEPKTVIKVGSCGVNGFKVFKDDPNKIIISFMNGAVEVYNLNKRAIEYQTQAGHTETVFDLDFSKISQDVFASCSYDGTIRTWEASSMRLIAINDTTKVPDMDKTQQSIIYSCSFAPNDMRIAMVNCQGLLLVF